MPIVDLTREVVEWIDGVAPGRQPRDTVVKLVGEASELLDAVINKGDDAIAEEIADCVICLLDLADSRKIDVAQAVSVKMEVNRKRKWKMEDGVLRRVRE